MRENRIHIAYGFHVNCYHSYRGDSNDALGFGSDLRIIRKILKTLNDLNAQGIPVKGTWDTENFFSLEKILPQYAPDIIEQMRLRTAHAGDEQIIMGYNNGALSAMTEAEFRASIEWAQENAQGSGLADLFGRCERIVRPQEVMFTPSQARLYRELGVRAVCLYYSCVPFDAFRTLVPRLPETAAYNPLTYRYQGESLTVIPTYSNADVCDAGCLRGWVRNLRAKQESGAINDDLFLFINMDADAIFWETLALGPLTGRLANTDGIHGLVTEVADLPYVVFDTPGGYLNAHSPVGEIAFTQDTADGNFTGYASWAEKPFNRKIWTRLERARAMAQVTAQSDASSPSFRDRVLLLSTTHFGLATPVLNIEREKTALALSQSALDAEAAAMPVREALTVHNVNGALLQCVTLSLCTPCVDLTRLTVTGPWLERFTAVPLSEDGRQIYLMLKFRRRAKQYAIRLGFDGAPRTPVPVYTLRTARMTLDFAADGTVAAVYADGRRIGGTDFLRGFLTYDGKDYDFRPTDCRPLGMGGDGQGLRVQGALRLPGALRAGDFTYDFFTSGCCEGVFVRVTVQYPYTPETDSISTENSALGRRSDLRWVQAAPFQLTPRLDPDCSVLKRNFMGDFSSYRVRSFPESDPQNQTLASFNHQLTAGFVGLTDHDGGLVVANARQVLGSMAHCPMRLEADGTVRMNPFGTYYGPQRHHFSLAKDEIWRAYTLIAPQSKSLAPAYNGSRETAVLGLFACGAGGLSAAEQGEICAFADGAVVSAPPEAAAAPCNAEFCTVREGAADGVRPQDLKSPMLTNIAGNLGVYVVRGVRVVAHILRAQRRARRPE